MTNPYYDHTSYPSQGAAGSSSAARAEFELIEAGFNKLPVLAGNGSEIVSINAGATALESIATTGTGAVVRATSPALTTPTGIVKGDVGLGNVDNTSDTNKPISTATQTALDAKQAALGFTPENAANRNAQNGYVGLIGFSFPVLTPAGDYAAVFANSLGTANRAITLPDENGLMALTSDITSGTLAGSFTKLTATNAAQGDPVTTGSTQTYGTFRMRSGNGVLDGGVNGAVAWLQATDANALGSLYTLKINPNGGNVLFGGGGFGYGIGAGGTVTQATSRTTGVTLNKPVGAITMFSAAGSATPATFTVTNSIVAAADLPEVVCKSSTNVYITKVTAVATGSFNITFWTTGGTATDQPVFNFSLGKGATA